MNKTASQRMIVKVAQYLNKKAAPDAAYNTGNDITNISNPLNPINPIYDYLTKPVPIYLNKELYFRKGNTNNQEPVGHRHLKSSVSRNALDASVFTGKNPSQQPDVQHSVPQKPANTPTNNTVNQPKMAGYLGNI